MDGDLPDTGLLLSPCVGICRLDPDTGWCLGCGRDAGELAVWGDLSAGARSHIWADLPRRKRRLGLGFRLLPWQGATLLDRLAAASVVPGAAWCVGVYGAVAELLPAPGAVLTAERAATRLIVRTAGGALDLAPPAGTRAFELVGASGRVERVVLALHRARLAMAPASGLAEPGVDRAALDPQRRHARLFDLGCALPPIRFCVRTGDPELVRALRDRLGADPLDPASGLVPRLLAASPDRVVTSPVGRIEVSGPIGDRVPYGPHTHLLPDLLARGRRLEPGFELPEGYVPCATLVPGG